MNPTRQAPLRSADLDHALELSSGELTGCVRRIRADVGRLVDPTIIAQYHPWLLIGSGVAIGVLGANGLIGASASRSPTAATTSAAAPVPVRPSFADRIGPLLKLVLPLLV